MVKFLVCFIFMAVSGQMLAIDISAEMDPYNNEGSPLNGTVSILHRSDESVDEKSFKIGNDPLSVQFVKDVVFSKNDNIILSLYHFTLPSKPAGLEMLPEVTAKVAGKAYHSVPVSYTIGDANSASANPAVQTQSVPSISSSSPISSKTASSPGKIPIILKLENILEGKLTVYPGQRLTVGYRFSFNFNVDLEKEELPLLSPDGFEKIGAKQTKSFMQGEMNVFEIRQQLEAKKTGIFKIFPGEISGRAYRILPSGSRENAPKESKANSDPVEISVLPFPGTDQPSSFNGAIGQNLTVKTALLSTDRVEVGDKLTVQIKISGVGEIHQLPIPTICCQPGFSGFFGFSDLPATESVEDQTKTFTLEMRPQTVEIKEIPSLEFSYFDPETNTYKTSKSKSIPITVLPQEKNFSESPQTLLKQQKSTNKEASPIPEHIETAHNETIQPKDLQNLPLGTWWVLTFIPVGAICLLFQIQHKKNLNKQKSIIKPITGEELFRKAMQLPPESPEFFVEIQQAFLLKLFERGDIRSIETSPDFLPTVGASGKVSALIREMEEKRFALTGGAFDKAFLSRIEKLFGEL